MPEIDAHTLRRLWDEELHEAAHKLHTATTIIQNEHYDGTPIAGNHVAEALVIVVRVAQTLAALGGPAPRRGSQAPTC